MNFQKTSFFIKKKFFFTIIINLIIQKYISPFNEINTKLSVINTILLGIINKD